MRRGISEVEWAGRFQVIKGGSRNPETVLDVCHNEDGVRVLVETFKNNYPGRKARIVAGFVKRKPHQAMVDLLAKIASGFCLVPLKTGRSMDTRELLSTLTWNGVPVERAGSLRGGLTRTLKRMTPDDILVIVGSHYLVGEYLAQLK